MSNPVAGTQETRMQPPANACRSQASSSNSQMENSAARCRVVLGNDLKQLPDYILATSELQPEHTQAHNSMSFHYSAMSPAARSARQAARAMLDQQVYRQNSAVTGMNMKGLHLHYLGRKIEQLKSKMTSYSDVLNSDIKWLNSKVDTYVIDLYKKRRMVRSNAVLLAPNSHLDIELLNEKLGKYARIVKFRIKLLSHKIRASVCDIKSNMNKLKIETAPYANDVGKQMKRLKFQSALYNRDLIRKMRLLRCKIIPCASLKREIRMMENGVIDYED